MPALPVEIQERLKRGQDRKERDAGMRNLCMEFVRGHQYMWLSEEGGLYDQSSILPRTTMTTWRRRHSPRKSP